MIIVRVELHSAIDGSITEIARMRIVNDGTGGDLKVGNYTVSTLRGRGEQGLNKNIIQHVGRVEGHPRLREHVWKLVAKALIVMGYNGEQP